MKKRLLSMLLVLSMVLTLIPFSGVRVFAEEPAQTTNNKDAFGITMDTKLTAAEADKKRNPYGTDGWFSLFTVSELFVAMGNNEGRSFTTYDYNPDNKVGSIGGATAGRRVGNKTEGNNKGFTMMDTSPCDPKGEGQDRYVAVLGYWKDQNIMQFYLADQNGNRVSQTVNVGSKDTLEYLETVESYNYTGFVSVATGDFDGDGKDSIVVYMPEMEKFHPYIREYPINDNLTIGNYRDVTANVFTDLIGIRDISKDNSYNSKVRDNTPLLQMTGSDTDNDNIDELVITTSMNSCSANDISKRESQLFIYDLCKKTDGGTTWSRTHQKSLNYSGGMKDAKRLRWASSSVGNISKSSGTDFPEIVTAGWIDKADNDSTNLTSNIGSFVTTCVEVNRGEGGTPVGTYNTNEVQHFNTDNHDQVSEFTSGGHYTNDDCQALLPVAVFQAEGVNGKASVLISDTVYQYDGSSFVKTQRDSYFNDDDDGIGGYIITNGLVIDAAVGNFDGNTDGREQVVFATTQKQSSKNDYFIKVYTYQKLADGWHTSNISNNNAGYDIYHKSDAFISLTPLDVDNDSTIARIKNVEKTYTEPQVLALLEAPPYFSEIDGGDIGNSETTYGSGKTITNGTTTSSGMTANIIAGFEWSVDDVCAGFVCGAGVEVSVEMGWTWETSDETSVTYELSYANDTGDNAVLVYRRPVLAYEYEIKNAKTTMVLAKEGALASSMVSVDEYNQAASKYGLDQISDGVLADEGDPFSYRNSAQGLENVVISEQISNYKSAGTTSQTFTNEESHSKAFTYDMSTSVTAYGMVLGTKFGGGGGGTTSSGNATINTTAISKGGAVTGANEDGYDFQWRFTHWTTPVNGASIPVLGYVLDNVVAPPSPPVNLQTDNIKTNSATITWTAGSRAADEYRIYQYFEATKNYIQVAAVDGTETSCEISNLLPNNTYRYVIRAYSAPSVGGAISGESVDSEQLAFTTAPEGAAPITIRSPEDANVRVGGTAQFTVGVTLPGSQYQTVTYQWQSRAGTAAWSNLKDETSSTLTLQNVGQDLDKTQYRCQLVALYSGSPIFYYSGAATMTVGRAAVEPGLEVNGSLSGEGSKINPYTGIADTLQKTGEQSIDVSAEENVTVANGTTNLLVYGTTKTTVDGNTVKTTTEAPYYGYDQNSGKYYSLSKNGEAYTVGSVITATPVKKYPGMTGTAITGVPSAFDSDKQILDSTGGYFLKAAVTNPVYQAKMTGTGHVMQETRLKGLTGLTYYWQKGSSYYAYNSADGSVGSSVVIADPASLYDVYHTATGAAVLGRDETWTVEATEESVEGNKAYADETGYWYENITLEGTPTATPFQETTETTYSVGGFDPAALNVVTAVKNKTVTEPVYDTIDGRQLSLIAKVTELGNSTPVAAGTKVNFKITNIDTAAVTTLTAAADGAGKASATWRAPTAGLYSIQSIVQADSNYATAASSAQYYDANSADQTEYRLNLKDLAKGALLTGTTPYGSTVTASLQQRTITAGTPGEWTNYTGEDIVYSVTPAEGTETKLVGNYTPSGAGIYTFRVYSGTAFDQLHQLASATLEVTRLSVTVTPTWLSIPTTAEAVTLNASPALTDGTNLKDIFNINSGYFGAAAGAYGRFTVMLTYKTDAAAAAAVAKFRNNYVATLQSDDFVIKPNSAQVNFSWGENGEMVGRYGDNLSTMATVSSQISGTKLTFQAMPHDGYAVDEWTINGIKYGPESTMPTWMTLSQDRNTLTIASFDAVNHTQTMAGSGTKALNVAATFRNAVNQINYGIGNQETAGTSEITATVSNTGSGEQSLASGTSVALGSKVTINAAPAAGYVIDHWTVDGAIYKRGDGNTDFRGAVLTLENVQEQHTVLVYFKQSSATFQATTEVYNEKNQPDAKLATITAANADSGVAINLNSLKNGDSVTFTANLASAINNTVKEWKISTDGTNYETVTGSGGQKTLTLYNLSSAVYVRAIVTVAQTYPLTYQVKLGDNAVNDPAIAALTAKSGDQTLTSGQEQNAYIPVNFILNLNDAYYVTGWSANVTQDAQNPKNAALDSLTAATTVTVNIKAKPVVTIASPLNGTVTVKGTVGGVADQTIANGAYVDQGSALAVTLKPDMGYEVNTADATAGLAYVDGSGATTDDKSYAIAAVTEDKTISHTFTPIAKYDVAYSVVDTNSDGQGDFGTLSANVERKGMEAYASVNDRVAALSGTTAAYRDGILTLNSVATTAGYRVKEWKINGKIYQEDSLTYTGNSLTLTAETLAQLAGDPAQTVAISVQFENGDPYINFVNPQNGTLTATAAGAEFISGGTSASPVTFNAQPNEHYEVKAWKVNGTPVVGETGNTFVLQPQGRNTTVEVTLQGKTLAISAKAGKGGSVSGAEGTIRYQDSVTLIAAAAKGYAFEGWYLGGSKITAAGADYSFTALADGAYEARFIASADNTVTFTANDEKMGAITATNNGNKILSGVKLAGGGEIVFTAEPKEGYRIKSWSGVEDSALSADKKTATVGALSGDLTVQITFEKIPTRTITLSNTTHGSVSAQVDGKDVTTVADGTEVTFIANPDKYWMLDAWIGDAQGKAGDTITLTVTSDITVGATFKDSINYTVEYSAADKNGSVTGTADEAAITANTQVQVVGGSKLKFRAAPLNGYMVKNWTLTVAGKPVDVSKNISTELMVESLSANTAVTVAYEQLTEYTVPANATGEYTIDNMTKTPEWRDGYIRKGGDVSFTVTPANGKVITALTVAGGVAERQTNGSWNVHVENAAQNVILTPTITNGIPLTITSGKNGSLSVTRLETALQSGAALMVGDSLTIKAAAEAGYTLDTLKVNGKAFTNGSKYIVTAEDTAVTAEATFRAAGGGDFGGGGTLPSAGHKITVMSAANGKISASAEKAASGDKIILKATSDKGYVLGDITAKDSDGKMLEITKTKTEYSFIMPEADVTVEAAFAKPFDDVKEEDYYYDPVIWAEAKEITTGTEDGIFSPNASCTRAQAVTFLWRAMGSPAPKSTQTLFTDISKDAYYYQAILWGVENGIVKGTSNTTFSPDMMVTRAHVATFLWRTVGKPAAGKENPFADVADSMYYHDAVLWAVSEQITNGTDNASFSPDLPCTRAQIVTFLYRYLKK